MRLAILILILMALAGCTTSHLGPQKPHEYFVTPGVIYLSESAGEFPSAVKRAVTPSLEAAVDVEKAYLVDIEYPDGTSGMCLCLAPGTAESARTADAIGGAFGLIAEQGVYLDIIFLAGKHLDTVERVAQPFYVRP